MEMEGLRPIRVSKEDSEDGQPLSPIARMFHQPRSNVYIIIIIGFKTPINPLAFKASLRHSLLKHPRFSSLQVVENDGEMRWVRTEVNLDNHVKVPVLDPNMEFPDKFVEDYASNLSKTTISMSMPLWDVHLLNVKTSEAESTGIIRIHHSLGDGISLMSLLLSCTRKASDPEALPTIPSVRRRNPSNYGGLTYWQFLLKLWCWVLLCWNTTVDALISMGTFFFLEDTKTPLKGALPLGPTPRRFVHRTISLDDVKLVKNAMGTTINDVIVAITQAGLSSYLNRKYGKYGDDEKDNQGGERNNNNLPNNIRFRAALFVNLRPSAGIQDFDDMTRTNSKARWGNHIGYVLFPLKIALRDDPLDYVRDAKVAGDRKKATLEANFTYLMAKLARFFPKYFTNKISCLPSRTTIWFSNVPGPAEEISYFGFPVNFIAVSVYGQPNALMIHVLSYANKMKIILSADEDIIPDPHRLCDDFQNSLELMKNAAITSKKANPQLYKQRSNM
ncbi:wax ester synthase/diacylglycerol acyltransferase 11-like [Hevea brasiliensis]|uniref:wax ester synthase/diacylglycerol acyltransferase 11-like n=1 Tax=Hevea brasiliensis TaxID=3981 RepID=UPI0025F7F573|nr:wax ester synthase/diacylglycerol acyltransferase 11-like [Hevea brasiliensis]